MGLFDSFLKKYNVNPEDNVPREVYGIPNALKKEKEKESYIYEYIPYEKVGPILLNKTDESKFSPSGVAFLNENGFNHVFCKPMFIDNPETIRRGFNDKELTIIIEQIKVKINCYYHEVLNTLKKISDDFIEYDELDDKFPSKNAYSRKLGIVLFAQKLDDNYYIQSLRFLGKDVFENVVEEIEQNNKKESNVMEINNKYNINEKENVPQFVYGIPDTMRKMWDEEDKKIDENCIFEAFEGGYSGPSYYYFINEFKNKYYFRFGYSKDGRYIYNARKNKEIHELSQNKEHYDLFIAELKTIIQNWNRNYNNNSIMDGTQWSIHDKVNSIDVSGSNEFPDNYSELVDLLNKYFNVSMYLKDDNKYNIEPEDNVPQKVYGVPKFKPEELKCPFCGSTNLLKYLYGEPAYDYDKEKFILGGCEINASNPRYKCKDCSKDIYRENLSPFSISNIIKNPSKYDINPEDNVPQKVYGIPNVKKNNENALKDTIKIRIKLDNTNYIIMLDKVYQPASPSKYDSKLFFIKGELENNFIGDVDVKIPVAEFENYKNIIRRITQNWNADKINYKTTKFNINWRLEQTIFDKEYVYSGINSVPANWNDFIDVISELEMSFKALKKQYIDTQKQLNPQDDELKKMISQKIQDPFFVELVHDYFKKNFESSNVALTCYKDLSKYDDIFNDFTKYLVKKSYDYPNQIEVEGYTPKKIHELNPSFKPSGVYSFLTSLRDNKEWAIDIINKNFPNKDVIPPVIDIIPKKVDTSVEKKVVKKTDWKTQAMPDETETFEFDYTLTEEGIKNLKYGHKPEEMEDKWFMYVEDNKLYAHRSWTGICIYIVELNTTGKLKVIANANKTQCNSTIEQHKNSLNDLLGYWTRDSYDPYEQFIGDTVKIINMYEEKINKIVDEITNLSSNAEFKLSDYIKEEKNESARLQISQDILKKLDERKIKYSQKNYPHEKELLEEVIFIKED